MNLGLTAGPLLGGLLIGTSGVKAAYAADVLTYLVAVYAAWRLPALPPLTQSGDVERQPVKGWASVAEGLRFLRTRTNLLMSFLVDIVAMVFGMPRALFPAVAVKFYGGGAGVVGLLPQLRRSAPHGGDASPADCTGSACRVAPSSSPSSCGGWPSRRSGWSPPSGSGWRSWRLPGRPTW